MTSFDPSSHPSGSGEQLWLDCVEKLAQELPEQQFNTWIKPLQAKVSEDQTKITILIGNRFKLDWVRTARPPDCLGARTLAQRGPP